MIRSASINKKFLKNKYYSILILDVNSLFLFAGRNGIKKMYKFINDIKIAIDNKNLLVINVIDNGISNKVLRKYPYYKSNRTHSIKSNNIYTNKFTKNARSFKAKISSIHKVDGTFKNHLTFYLPGESDFKIGWLLKFLNNRTLYNKDEILTVSFDKDLILTNILSDCILKRYINNRAYQHLIDNNVNMKKFNELLRIKTIGLRNVNDFFYYLLLNGDRIDNIKCLLDKNQIKKLFNLLYSKYGKITFDLICKHINEFVYDINGNDILENSYLIDLYNDDIFSTSEKNTMNYVMLDFLKKNKIKVL